MWYVTLQLPYTLHSFSSNGDVRVKRDVTDINIGRYLLRINVGYTLTFKNGTRKFGRTSQYFYFYVLGKSGDAI